MASGDKVVATNKKLREVLVRAETWPPEAQEELAELALQIESGQGGAYHALPEELVAIDEADASGVATEAEVRRPSPSSKAVNSHLDFYKASESPRNAGLKFEL